MAISQDKVRTIITIPKDLKKKLEKIAKQDNRSFNNLVIKILKDFVSNSLNKKARGFPRALP